MTSPAASFTAANRSVVPCRSLAFEGNRVLLVDEDSAMRNAVEMAFDGEGFAVRSVPDGSSIEKVIQAFQPDVAIIGVRLPNGPDGFTMVRRLRQVDDLPVLLLTPPDSLDDRLTGFRVGADDSLSKPVPMAELVARVRALLRRTGRRADHLCRTEAVEIDTATRRVFHHGVEIDLTRTEYDVLVVLCRHSGHVVSKQRILEQVWGESNLYDDDDNVVEVHVCRLRRKLEAEGPRLIHTVRTVGYVIRP